MARILLGVCGGIAAYKALELVRLATGEGHAVRVVQTPAAQRFVGAASFAGLTGAPVLVSEWERDPARGAFPGDPTPEHDPLSHLQLVANADLYVVAPASANTLAKLAAGLADNLLTSAALAATCPILVAPAMNNHMWDDAATQANLATLRDRGLAVVGPGEGRLGSAGEWGVGRLAEPREILDAALALLAPVAARPHRPAASGPWLGRRVLVTAGGTREPIDAVRFVGNRSSGRMGFALAEAATQLGAQVTLVAANVALPTPHGVLRCDVQTAAELQLACETAWEQTDVLLMSAAVADFRPVDPAVHKLKKDGRDELLIRMEPTPDVLLGLSARRRPGQLLVGFAAETGDGAIAYGRGKLERKGLDCVVVNDVAQPGIGFDTPDNEVTLVTAGAERAVTKAAKSVVAHAILEFVADLTPAQPPST